MVPRYDDNDKCFTIDKKLRKDGTFGKTGETNAPKTPVLNTYDITDYIFPLPPQEYFQKYRSKIRETIPAPVQLLGNMNIAPPKQPWRL